MKEAMTKERFMQELVVGMVAGDRPNTWDDDKFERISKERAHAYWRFAKAIVEVGEVATADDKHTKRIRND